MTTANQAYKTAKTYGEDLGEDVSDFARDVSKQARKARLACRRFRARCL